MDQVGNEYNGSAYVVPGKMHVDICVPVERAGLRHFDERALSTAVLKLTLIYPRVLSREKNNRRQGEHYRFSTDTRLDTT